MRGHNAVDEIFRWCRIYSLVLSGGGSSLGGIRWDPFQACWRIVNMDYVGFDIMVEAGSESKPPLGEWILLVGR